MTFLALNLVLAIVWLFLTGSFGTVNLLFGFVIGYLVIRVGEPYLGSGGYIRSVRGSFRFLWVFLSEIVRANIQLARDLLRPELPFKPGIVRYETEGLTQGEVAVLANMICLTPGTVAMDTDEEGRVLYIHSVYADDPNLHASFDHLAGLIKGVKHPLVPASEEVP